MFVRVGSLSRARARAHAPIHFCADAAFSSALDAAAGAAALGAAALDLLRQLSASATSSRPGR
eukprot:8050383-Pyramimonas_sp.AAC.1